MGGLRGLAVRELGWCCAYLAITLVGLLSLPVGPGASTVWSGAGVVALWLAASSGHRLAVDLLTALALVAVVDLVATGSGVEAVVLLAAHVVQTLVVVPALRAAFPHLHGFGGNRALTTPGEATRFVVLSLVSAGAGCVVAAVGLGAAGSDIGSLRLLADVARSTAGLLIVLVVGTQLVRRAAELRGRVAWAPYHHSWRSPVEPVLLWALSLSALVVVFGPLSSAPLGFLLLSITVLVAARLGPIGAMAHAVLAGGVAILLNGLGEGPFTAVEDLAQRDLVVQVYGLVSFVTALLVSFSQHDRAVVGARLEKLQRRTAAQARELRAVLEHLQEGLAVVGDGGEVVLANATGEQLLDRGALRSLDGTALQDGEHPFERAARGERFQDDYHLVPRTEGEPTVLEVVGGPVPGDALSGLHARGVVSFRDVTALRHDRDALAAFAGVVAHDLKRPLTGIVGWTGLLAHRIAEGELDRRAWGSMLERVSSAAGDMTSLLDDLLLYTVVRDAPARSEEVDVSALAEQAAELFRSRESRPLVTVQPGLAAVADPVLLRQVLDNLVGNAVKYVAPGVQPRVHVGGRTEGGETVLVVRDNGIGISPELRQRVFEVFQRAHGDEYRGTGLGLAIVRRAVERCDGTVTVRDPGPGDAYPDGTTADTGTVFEVRLPAPVHAGAFALAALLPPVDEQRDVGL